MKIFQSIAIAALFGEFVAEAARVSVAVIIVAETASALAIVDDYLIDV